MVYRVPETAAAEVDASSGRSESPPCGMKLFFKLLLPNKGRESAVFSLTSLTASLSIMTGKSLLNHQTLPWAERITIQTIMTLIDV